MGCNTHQRKQGPTSRVAGGLGRDFMGTPRPLFFAWLCANTNTSRHLILLRAAAAHLFGGVHSVGVRSTWHATSLVFLSTAEMATDGNARCGLVPSAAFQG